MLKHFAPLRRRTALIVVVAILLSILTPLPVSQQPKVFSNDPPAPLLRLIESDDPAILREGNWSARESASASGGGYLLSGGDQTDVLTLLFTGPRVEIVYVRQSTPGRLAIEIDNTARRTINTTADPPQFGRRAVISYLSDEIHVLRVYATEGAVAIDAFYASGLVTLSEALPNVEQEVIDEVLAKGEARVFINLRHNLPPDTRDSVLYAEVARLQNNVLSVLLPSDFQLTYQYGSVPGLAGAIRLSGLLRLRSHRDVLSVTLRGVMSLGLGGIGESRDIINVDDVVNQYGMTGQGVTVAVIDSGIDINHQERI